MQHSTHDFSTSRSTTAVIVCVVRPAHSLNFHSSKATGLCAECLVTRFEKKRCSSVLRSSETSECSMHIEAKSLSDGS